MNKRILITTLAEDPHTQGLFNFTRIARESGFEVTALPPGSKMEEILKNLRDLDPEYVGFSYRLSPEIGLDQLALIMNRISENGLLKRNSGEKRKFAFAGLPSTIELIENSLKEFGIFGIKQSINPLESVEKVLDYLDVKDSRRTKIIASARERLMPPRIEILDHLADDVIRDSSMEPPMNIPSDEAKKSYTKRISEVWPGRPILRTHYGEPGETISPTVEGIKKLAEARVIDELSLGSSDLSQRYYNEPDKWIGRKNDGGVPYKNLQDLIVLNEASRRGNYPAVKPYAHVVNQESFVDECIKAGMLTGAHQAVPLYWFNELDGRGPTGVLESLKEHKRTVEKLTKLNIPVEMNDPNHWSSRWGSDAVVVADYALIASVMLSSGVRDLVFQLQFNKPKETSDYGDLAKFTAAIELIKKLIPEDLDVKIWIEARTGIEQFQPDLEIAKKQLARSTLLQSLLNPHAIHIVSYCEALYAAKPDDIIHSSSIIRKAVKVSQKNKSELQNLIKLPQITERKEYLLKEASFLISEIAKLNSKYDSKKSGIKDLYKYLSNADTLYKALELGYMSAPGIFTEPFRKAASKTYTDVIQGGFINSIDPVTLLTITEEDRLNHLGHFARS